MRCCLPRPRESGEVDHRAVEDPHEPPQKVAVVDADDDLPQGAALDDLTQHDAQDRIRGELEIGRLKIELGLGIDLGTQVGPPFAYLLMVDQ